MRQKSKLFSASLAVLLLIISGLLWAGRVFHASSAPITDASRYREVLNRLGYPTPHQLGVPTLASFPPGIPAGAANVRFYFQPAALQGGAQLQLRYNLPSADLQKVLAQARPMAKEVQAGGDMFDAINSHRGLPSCSFRNAANSGFDPLPADFQVFVLNAKAAAGSESTWNHGWSYGIAVSESRQEVVYWLEDW